MFCPSWGTVFPRTGLFGGSPHTEAEDKYLIKIIHGAIASGLSGVFAGCSSSVSKAAVCGGSSSRRKDAGRDLGSENSRT